MQPPTNASQWANQGRSGFPISPVSVSRIVIAMLCIVLSACQANETSSNSTLPTSTPASSPSAPPPSAAPTIAPPTQPPASPTAKPTLPAPSASPTAAPKPGFTPVMTATPLAARPTALPVDATTEQLELALVAAINELRNAHGLPPYAHSPELSAAARAHSCDIATHSLISHTSSDGRTLAERLAGAEPPWEWPSENIAAGTNDPVWVVELWMDEPPDGWHRRNLLSEEQREVGVGYCFNPNDPTNNQHYWTADFSRRG